MSEIDKKPRRFLFDGEDRISALPDSLIHHILSLLDLKPVIATSLLSRRWRYLWTSVPTLDLGTWYPNRGTKIPIFITLSLMLYYDSPKIHKFRARFDYPVLTESLIDAWIRFATKRHVEELDLNLFIKSDRDNVWVGISECYKVLPCLFECQTLQILKLTFCDLTLHSSLRLCLLKKLELNRVLLSDLDTSGCPLLESLILRYCNTEGYLNVYAPNQKLGYLKIEDDNDTYGDVTLFAPNLLSIQFTGSIRQAYNIKNLPSLRSASLDFYNIKDFQRMYHTEIPIMFSLVELLGYVSHASTLKFSLWCIKDLRFWEAKGLELPQFKATCVHLETNLNESDLLWAASVLRNCQCLESLILTTTYGAFSRESWRPLSDGDFDEAWDELELSLSSNRQIKTVKVNDFLRSESCWLRKVPEPSLNIDEFLEKWEKEIKLVELLLSSCMVLEKMIISTLEMPPFWPLKSELLLGLKKRLLALPRVSRNAKIYFS